MQTKWNVYCTLMKILEQQNWALAIRGHQFFFNLRVAKISKQLKCPKADEQIKKL